MGCERKETYQKLQLHTGLPSEKTLCVCIHLCGRSGWREHALKPVFIAELSRHVIKMLHCMREEIYLCIATSWHY